MSAVAEKTVTIDQNWLNQNKNEKADDSSFDRLVDYSGKSSGAYREMSLLRNAACLGNAIIKEAGSLPSAALSGLDHNLGIGAAALGLVRLPSATKEAVKSLSALGQNADDGIDFSRKAAKAVRDTTDAIAAYGYSALFITGNPVARSIAQITDFTSDLADLQISASDYNQACILEKDAIGDVKEAVTHSKNYYFRRIIKDIVGIAAVILGFVALALGASLMPVIAWIVISIVSTTIAIARDVHKDTGKYKVINFDRRVIV